MSVSAALSIIQKASLLWSFLVCNSKLRETVNYCAMESRKQNLESKRQLNKANSGRYGKVNDGSIGGLSYLA